MIIKKLAGTAVLASILLAGTVQAEEAAGVYVGITGGVDKIDLDLPPVQIDDGSVTGVLLGYRAGNGLAFEFAAAQSEADVTGAGAGCDSLDIDTMAIYGAWRSSGTVYFKGRAGLLREEADLCGISEDDAGISIGAGVGARFGMVSAEVEFTMIEQDVNRGSLSVFVNF